MANEMIPVLISGGQGTRLWPLSRSKWPKPFCEFVGESLLSASLKRLLPLGSPFVVTTRELAPQTLKTLKSLNLSSKSLVQEPFGKNTAAAVALAVRGALMNGASDDSVMGIFPADHLIADEENYRKALVLAANTARTGKITTLGIKPHYPATGYGYIEVGPELEKGSNQGVRFCEKPNLETATTFAKEGRYFWNAGVFVFRLKDMAAALEKYLPALWRPLKDLKPDFSNVAAIYEQVPNISIDYGVMEKLETFACVPVSCGWNDVGSWDEVAQVAKPSPSVEVQGKNNSFFSYGENKTAAFVGVDDLVVVNTRDALLIAKKGSTQAVKEALEVIKKTKPELGSDHMFEERPWGRFEILREEDHYKSKIVRVEAGEQLSYQSHNQRVEHWVVVEGHGEVILDDKVLPVQRGTYVFIPRQAKHRIRNTGTGPMEFLEVQIGEYFGEDDIIRYSDDYGRTK